MPHVAGMSGIHRYCSRSVAGCFAFAMAARGIAPRTSTSLRNFALSRACTTRRVNADSLTQIAASIDTEATILPQQGDELMSRFRYSKPFENTGLDIVNTASKGSERKDLRPRPASPL